MGGRCVRSMGALTLAPWSIVECTFACVACFLAGDAYISSSSLLSLLCFLSDLMNESRDACLAIVDVG